MRNNIKLTFSNVCKRIRDEKYTTEQGTDDLKLLLDIAGCFFETAGVTAVAAGGVAAAGATPVGTAVAGGVSAAAVIAAVSKKGVVLNGVKRIIELLRKNSHSYSDRYEHMQEAYVLLCVASFFDAYSNTLSKDLLDQIALSASEQAAITEDADIDCEIKDKRGEPVICLPHIVYGCAKVYPMLKTMYSMMTNRLRCFIDRLAFPEESEELIQLALTQGLNELPHAAIEVFKDQYLTLCSQFSDFYAYINLEKEREYANEAEERYRNLVEMILHSDDRAQQSFSTLASAIASFPAYQRAQVSKEITDHIREKYIKAIKRTIVSKEDDENLSYPTIEDAFIPQRYRLLEYKTKDIRLELETEWEKHDENRDMLAYWARYILDPQSTENLFLILGDPGGGKSLLMEMLSARLSSDAELVIKVPLRRYSNICEMDIEPMLCKQIVEDGDAAMQIDRLKQITGSNPMRPFTLIFDGYDEVQQATGLAFRSFLTKLKRFQELSGEENRPVRIIVTSRRTLIDKADIPLGTTVMKLLDFDERQKDEWIQIWNTCNHERLKAEGLQDLRLPEDSKEIKDLSGQPLLLLMLAIYDADFENKVNALQQNAEEYPSKGLNRMRLYDELIRRFIRRELAKGRRGEEVSYEDADDKKRQELINAEMDKLGVAAFGMFIREKLFITVPELKNDIEKFKKDTARFSHEGALDPNEVFFGSFFFIHDSRTETEKNEEVTPEVREFEKDASFVFLHKTFYEFLVADFALSGLYRYAIDLAGLKSISLQHYKSLLTSFLNEFPQFYLLASSSPLCAEPEIINMIEEWSYQKLNYFIADKIINVNSVVDVIEDIICSHVNLVKSGTMNPGNDLSLLPDRLMPQQNAIYCINLVTLRTLITGEWKTDAETWNYIAQFVKLNAPRFKENDRRTSMRHRGMDSSEELPLRFMALFRIVSDENTVTIKKRLVSITSDDRTPLDAKAEIFAFLHDEISQSLFSFYSSKTHRSKKKTLQKRISSFDETVDIDSNIIKLCEVLSNNSIRCSPVHELYEFVKLLSNGLSDYSRITIWLLLYRRVIDRHMLSSDYQRLDSYADRGSQILFNRLVTAHKKNVNDCAVAMKLWVGILSQLNLTSTIAELLDNAIRGVKNGLFKPKEWLFDLIKALPLGYESEYYNRYAWKIHNLQKNEMFLNNDLFHLPENINCPPKVLASLLEANRKLNHRHYVNGEENSSIKLVEEIILRHRETVEGNIIDPFRKELPYLLRELVIQGEDEYVRHVLDEISYISNMINEPLILDYVSIADAVSAHRFMNKIINLFGRRATTELTQYTAKAVLQAAVSLAFHGQQLEYGIVRFLLTKKGFIDECMVFDPTQTAKLLCLIFRQGDRDMLPDSFRYDLSRLLDNFEIILQHSPSTALELLSLSATELKYNSNVINYYLTIARINGYAEEIERFFGRNYNDPLNNG